MRRAVSDIKELIRPNILELEPYRCARDTAQEGLLLDANENPFQQKWAGVLVNRYPDPRQQRLRQALADYVGVGPENVAAGVGSDEVVEWIFKVFCQPGQDSIVTAEPTYGMYQVTAQVFGVAWRSFLLNDAFDFGAADFLSWVEPEAKVLFLCSPNNPTGNLLTRQEILQVCESWKGVVVVDEAYQEFSDAPSIIAAVREFPNLIVLRTMSKALGRAGLRLGYAVAPEEIISYFLKVKTPYNLSAVAIEQGCQTLQQQQARNDHVELIRSERERVAERLRDLSGVRRVFPSKANFLLFRCPKATEVVRRLLQRGIVVRDRSSMPKLADCIRVTIGTHEENNRFLEALEVILDDETRRIDQTRN